MYVGDLCISCEVMCMDHIARQKHKSALGGSCRPWGVCKTRTGYLRMVDADGKMGIEKCGWKKNKQTNN